MLLETIVLPMNMSAALAQDLARCITGHVRETDLSRYTALTFHYLSWSVAKDLRFEDYVRRAQGLPNDDVAALLLPMAEPATFVLQGMETGETRDTVNKAREQARTWAQELVDKKVDVLKLHRRLLVLLADMMTDEPHMRNFSGDEVMSYVLSHHPELLIRLNRKPASYQKLEDLPEAVRQMNPGLRTPQDNEAKVQAAQGNAGSNHAPEGRRPGQPMQFESPLQALAFVFNQMHNAQRQQRLGRPGGLPPPGAGSAPENTAAPGNEVALREQTPTHPALQVFNPVHAVQLLQKMPSGMSMESNGTLRRLLESMSQDHGWRELRQVQTDHPLDALRERFPHFKQVLDFIEGALALAACGEEGRVARIPPLLLRGEPGCGKTYFAQELAKALGTEFVERDMSVTSEAFVISGMDSAWKNSKPGVVFNAVVQSKTANPLICINEIDKAKTGGSHNSPLAAMYALLEPTSAERFQDEFVQLNIDASRVIWVLTANDGDIPDPILSRLEVFEIPMPTPDQRKQIAQSVWKTICNKAMPKGHGFEESLSEEVLETVKALSPRVMRKELTRAASVAALEGRKVLISEDLQEGSKRYSSTGGRRSMGFSASM